jgi:tetratricopeptide (TPR) repeat protein/CHAT domain-containing protein
VAVLLGSLLAGRVSPAAEEKPAEVRFADDFAADSRKEYDIGGEVAWRKGALQLGTDAAVERRLPLGFTAEVRTTVGWSAEAGDRELVLALAGDENGVAGVVLKRSAGKVTLVDSSRHEVILGEAGARGWEVRLDVRYGLVRARAWRRGEEEPAEWQVIRQPANVTFQPVVVRVGSPTGGISLEGWQVRGVAPWRPEAGAARALARAAELNEKAGGLYGEGKFAAAGLLYEEALVIRRKALHSLHPLLAQSLNNRGLLLKEVGQHGEARPLLDEALAIQRKVLPRLHPELAATLNNLGLLLMEMGRHGEARPLLEEALAIRRKALPPLHPLLAQSLNNLGVLLTDMGKQAEARLLYKEAVAIQRKVLPPLHPALAGSLINLGLVLKDMGKPAEARPLLEEALAIYRKALPPHHPYLANCLGSLGLVLKAMGKPAEARPLLEEAVGISRKTLPPLHPQLALDLNNLGGLLLEMGQPAEARPLLEEALAICRKSLPPLHPDLGASLINLGVLLWDMGKHAEARPLLEEALAINRKTLPQLHPDLAISLGNLGWLLWEMGRADEAFALLEEAATSRSGHASLTVAATAQRDHAPVLATRLIHLEVLLSAAVQSPGEGSDRPRRALAALLDGKAVSGAALRARRTFLAALDAQTSGDVQRLQVLQQKLADLLLRGSDPHDPGRYRADCEDLRRRGDELEADLARRVAPFAKQRLGTRASPGDLAALLPDAAALVELIKYRRHRFGPVKDKVPWVWDSYLAFVLWKGSSGQPVVRLVDLGPATGADAAVRAWWTTAAQGQASKDADERLRQMVWEPLARAVPEGTRRLYIAPDGELSRLPFEAIREADGKYLVERLAISYLSSGRDLAPLPRPTERPDTAVVLADPDYDSLDGKPATAALPPGRDEKRSGLGRAKRLAGFAAEAGAVEKLLGGRRGWRLESRRDKEASEEVLGQARRPRLVYCVTHGFFLQDVERPQLSEARKLGLADAEPGRWRAPEALPDPRLRSGLVLAGANRWQERAARGLSDGWLTALEVEKLDLWGTELVVLSACDTGRGEVQVGEGTLGLRRAFQIAGAECVLASLWPVPDAETGALMADCLRRWLGGAPPAAALRQAQLEMIRKLREGKDERLRQAPPLYWAGFVCHGRSP